MNQPVSERVRIPVGGAEMVGDVALAGPGDGWAVVWVHGFGSRRGGEKSEALRAACGRRGWSFAAFDFLGHGESGGSMAGLRGSGLLTELEAVRRWLAGRGVRRLGLVGSSMGGWASAWFARQVPEAVAG